MRYKRFAAWFRKDASLTFWSIVAVVSLMWILTIYDLVFNLGWGWGWDREGFWTAPVILLIAVAIRFWQAAVNKLIDYLSNGS